MIYLTTFIDDDSSQIGQGTSLTNVEPIVNANSASWVLRGGTTGLTLDGGRLLSSTGGAGTVGGVAMNLATIDLGAADFGAMFTLYSATNYRLGYVFRYDPSDDSFYMAYSSTKDFQILWFDGSSFSEVYEVSNLFDVGKFNCVEINVDGNEIQLLDNGVVQRTDTISNNQTLTHYGLYGSSSGNGGLSSIFATYDVSKTFAEAYPPVSGGGGGSTLIVVDD